MLLEQCNQKQLPSIGIRTKSGSFNNLLNTFFITNGAELTIYFRHQGISTCHLFIALVLFTVWVNGHTFREIVKMSGSLDMTESSSKCIQSPDLLWLFLLWYFIGLCQCYFKTSILSEVNVFIEIKLTYMNFI